MKTSVLFLRIGVAFSLLYAAVAGFIDPTAWIGYFPLAIQNLGPAPVVVGVWGIFETLLAAVLLFKRHVFYSGLLAAALLFGIVVFNWGAMDIVFRDVAIGFAALSLAFLTRRD